MSKQISLRVPDQLLEDLKSLSEGGKYQSYMIQLLQQSVKSEISKKIPQLIEENNILKQRIEMIEKQSNCRHSWIGKSENQYCSKCGVSD